MIIISVDLIEVCAAHYFHEYNVHSSSASSVNLSMAMCTRELMYMSCVHMPMLIFTCRMNVAMDVCRAQRAGKHHHLDLQMKNDPIESNGSIIDIHGGRDVAH